ncbi:MAG: DUF2232 domain-containing protein [Deltaproteobacteria bacterium]|nr:DUF2232 domain-containing protein [Deltaproteobacteria bacterium]
MAASRPVVWLLGLACLSLLFLAGHLHPLAYLVMGTWLPLPILLVGWRLGNRAALALALAAAVLVFATQPTLSGLLDNLSYGELFLTGVLLSSFRQRGYPAGQVIVFTVAAVSLIALIFLVGQSLLSGLTLLELLQKKAGETARTLNKVFAETGVDGGTLMLPGFSQLDWGTLVARIFPALFVINAAFVAWLNMVTAKFLAHTLNWKEPGLPLAEWANPEWLIFVLLMAGFMLLVPLKGLRLVSLNILLVVGFLYFCQGVAVVAAMFHRFQVPLFLRLMGYPLLFINPLFFMVIILGLMDLWLDFRRLHQPRDA